MARFDVYSLADGSLVVDCQADFLDEIGTRFVVPLLPRGDGPAPHARINPSLTFRGETLVLVPQLAGALRTSELRRREGSLDHEQYTITHAIDVLIGTA
jgi:toxin CcdB